jgi:hypothetical protein
MAGLPPRVIVVHRVSEFDELLARHGTGGQARFYLRARGRDLDEVRERHEQQRSVLARVSAAIPADWRRGRVERADLDRFGFDPGDLVVAVGADGLVANIAKYVPSQPVIGVSVDPQPSGLLIRHRVDEVAGLLRAAAADRAAVEARTMVAATTDGGQTLLALNEVFVGHRSHQSARYRLQVGVGGAVERQSSSGLIVGTGTGATGWCASLVAQRDRGERLPAPTDPELAWFVREAWPSPTTGTALTAGRLTAAERLAVDVESEGMVVFGDGIESDRLELSWGQRVQVHTAAGALRLVVGG